MDAQIRPYPAALNRTVLGEPEGRGGKTSITVGVGGMSLGQRPSNAGAASPIVTPIRRAMRPTATWA